MSQMTSTTPMTEDAKMLAASAAARTERANKPTLLVLVAALGLACSLVWLLVAWNSQRDAVRALQFQQNKSTRVAERVAQLLALRGKVTAGEAVNEGNAPLNQLLPRISTAASTCGIKDTVPPPGRRTGNTTAAGSRQLFLDYNVTDESLPALLAWIEKSMADVPGLELYKVFITPEQQKWRLKVTFTRWEKVEGA